MVVFLVLCIVISWCFAAASGVPYIIVSWCCSCCVRHFLVLCVALGAVYRRFLVLCVVLGVPYIVVSFVFDSVLFFITV